MGEGGWVAQCRTGFQLVSDGREVNSGRVRCVAVAALLHRPLGVPVGRQGVNRLHMVHSRQAGSLSYTASRVCGVLLMCAIFRETGPPRCARPSEAGKPRLQLTVGRTCPSSRGSSRGVPRRSPGRCAAKGSRRSCRRERCAGAGRAIRGRGLSQVRSCRLL